ncbi:hypothetical protein OG742_12305 [Streptomyces sp. NBC_00828]|uniref:hypothetical protein n=1 Tax=Streptomyces sp. NBC_00828 TaxID=2903678 RepID=UPI00386B2843
MLSRIRRWWRLRRTHRDDTHPAVVVIVLPSASRTADSGTGPEDSDAHKLGGDELNVRAALLAALGEAPAPGGDR